MTYHFAFAVISLLATACASSSTMSMPYQMRRMIYTTNPVEAVHRVMRKLIKSKAAWVSSTALMKQLYLSLMQNKKSWKRRAYNWKSTRRELMELYPERVPTQ